jgi:hypothetical protein
VPEPHAITVQRILSVARAAIIPVTANGLVIAFSGSGRVFVFNLDYVLVPIVYFFVNRFIGHRTASVFAGLLLSLLLAADFWGCITGTYFANPGMLFDLLPFVAVWPWRLLAPLLLTAVAVSIALVEIASRYTARCLVLVPLLLLLGVVSCADFVFPRFGSLQITQPKMISSGLANLFRPFINQIRNESTGDVRKPLPLAADSFALSYNSSRALPNRVLSIGIESWGILKDSKAQQTQTAILTNGLGRDYSITIGAHVFHGATLDGEVRELCGLGLNGVPRTVAERSTLRGCLPRILEMRGYATSGWHGNSSSFYRRGEIYPAMGFQDLHFYESMRPSVSVLCHRLFVGICDRDVLGFAVAKFRSQKLSFVHVMTLDTHLPLPRPVSPCPSNKSAQLCSYEEGIGQTLNTIVTSLREATIKPDLVVVYGDHAPPFLDSVERARFAVDKVPYVVLTRISR